MSNHPSEADDRASWAALTANAEEEAVEDLEFFDDLPARITAARAPDSGGANLGGIGITMTSAAVLVGPDSIAPTLKQLQPLLADIITELEPVPDRAHRLAAFYTLSYLNVARCCGATVPAQSEDVEGTWLRELAAMREGFSEPERHTLALAACAAGIPEIVPTFVGAGKGPPTFKGGETYGFNVPAFALAIAAAIDAGAGYEDVEMAWLDFVNRFPIKLDTDMLDWPALLWAARAVYATIGGIPVEEVADELHRLVTGA